MEDLGYRNINAKISQLIKKEIFVPIKNALYLYKPLDGGNLVSKEIVSNLLLGPSYISLDYALYFHSLIPESVHELTAITTKRSKLFDTPLGVFSYKQTKKELFALGIEIASSKSGNFMIASKEKALCDKVYFTTGVELRNKRAMLEFLQSDLRVDLDELVGADQSIFEQYLAISHSKKIEVLCKVIKELQYENS